MSENIERDLKVYVGLLEKVGGIKMDECLKNLCKSIVQRVKQKPYKWGFWFIFVVLIFIPTIIWLVYLLGDYGVVLIHTSLGVGDALSFYGTVLTFAGTVALSALALWQNKQIARKSQEYTELMERNERQRSLPVLKLSLAGRNGALMNLAFNIKNFSENIATFIEATPFNVYNKSGEQIYTSPKPNLEKTMIMGGESIRISFSNIQFQEEYHRLEFEINYNDKFANVHSLRITGTEINIPNNLLSIQQEEIS